MKQEDVQKIKVNVGVLYEQFVGELNRGTIIDRDRDPERFEILTRNMSNVGEDESCDLLVIQKVGEEAPGAAEAKAKAAAEKKAKEEAKAAEAKAKKEAEEAAAKKAEEDAKAAEAKEKKTTAKKGKKSKKK